MTNPKDLRAIIDAMNDSLEVVAHNPVETEYVLKLRDKYEKKYYEITGRHYDFRLTKLQEEKNGKSTNKFMGKR